MKVLPLLGVLVLALVSGCGDRCSVNVVLICVDALRADHLGCYGYPRNTSPVLDSLAAAGTLYENCQSQAPWTLPSHASLFTGLSVVSHGTGQSFGRLTELDEHLPSLPVQLRNSGYNTMGIVNVAFLSPDFGFDRGFRIYDYLPDEEPRNAERTVEMANVLIDRAADSREPFFLFIHLWDVHTPYTPPRPYNTMFLDGKASIGDSLPENGGYWPIDDDGLVIAGCRDHLMALYDGGIAYTDDRLRGLFCHIRELGLAENTLIIVMSDHGEEFLEHGGVEHGKTLFQEQLHVPLIIAGPGVPPAQVVSEPVGLYDVFPSIMAYIGREVPPGIEGQDILTVAAAPGRLIPSSGIQDMRSEPGSQLAAIRRGNEKVIYDVFSDLAMMFELTADPGEVSEITPADPVLVSEITKYLTTPPAAVPGEVTDTHELASIRTLGYIN